MGKGDSNKTKAGIFINQDIFYASFIIINKS